MAHSRDPLPRTAAALGRELFPASSVLAHQLKFPRDLLLDGIVKAPVWPPIWPFSLPPAPTGACLVGLQLRISPPKFRPFALRLYRRWFSLSSHWPTKCRRNWPVFRERFWRNRVGPIRAASLGLEGKIFRCPSWAEGSPWNDHRSTS